MVLNCWLLLTELICVVLMCLWCHQHPCCQAADTTQHFYFNLPSYFSFQTFINDAISFMRGEAEEVGNHFHNWNNKEWGEHRADRMNKCGTLRHWVWQTGVWDDWTKTGSLSVRSQAPCPGGALIQLLTSTQQSHLKHPFPVTVILLYDFNEKSKWNKFANEMSCLFVNQCNFRTLYIEDV